MHLYQINAELTAKMTALGELLTDGGEPSDEQVSELLDLQGELEQKLTNYGFVVKNLIGELDSVDNEIKRLTAIKKSKARHIDTLANRMEQAMIENGIKEVNIDPTMPIKLRNNPPSVRLDIDAEHLPSDFVRVKYEADKTAISKALKAGIAVAGASLESKQSIKIG